MTLEQLREEEIKDKERERIENENKLMVKKIIKDQHEEQKAKLIKRIQEEKIEGEIIKRKDIQAQQDQM